MYTHIRIKVTLMLQLTMSQPIHHGTKPLLELIVTYVFIWGIYIYSKGKGKGRSHNRPSRWPKGGWVVLRPPDFLTFSTTRVVGHQPHAPATFTPRRNPWYSF
jgi:hypothetical protein